MGAGGEVGRGDDPAVTAQPQGQPPQRRGVGGAQGNTQPAVRKLIGAVVRVVLGDPAAARADLDDDPAREVDAKFEFDVDELPVSPDRVWKELQG